MGDLRLIVGNGVAVGVEPTVCACVPMSGPCDENGVGPTVTALPVWVPHPVAKIPTTTILLNNASRYDVLDANTTFLKYFIACHLQVQV